MDKQIPERLSEKSLARREAYKNKTKLSQRKKFIGNIDYWWCLETNGLSGTTIRVGEILWHLYWLTGGKDNYFTVTRKLLREWGISPKYFNKALDALKKRGLIDCEIQHGKKTKIRLIREPEGSTKTK
jgi:hypothetical protein